MTASFSESYVEARGKFLVAASDVRARIHTYGRDDLRGRDGEYLACDVAVLGVDDAERAAIIITGTHGVEGYCGSAILHRWLTLRMAGANVEAMKIVLVHAINPWAFSHKTRTTENNVDLNRNFLRGEDGYRRPNPSYDKLLPFLHADKIDAKGSLAAHKAYKNYLDQHGWHIENEMLQGQSHRPDGLFYAGTKPEWANLVFRKIINDHLGTAKAIGFIDWHTGVGSFGEIVYLVFDDANSTEHDAAANWWGHSEVGKGAFNSGAIPKYEGLLCRAIRQELTAPRIAGAVIEFGTADDYGMFRADRLDRWLWFEGSGDERHSQFREDYKRALCPRDVAWKELVLSEGPAIMDRMISGIRAW